jgi:Fe(3+) dicitrate transport protein
MNLNIFRIGIGALFILVSVSSIFAADNQPSESIEVQMREVAIIGSKFNIKDIAGSAAYLDTQDIRQQNVDDINRILRRVPGVNLRGEDGFGLFPNISLRGIDAARSAKVTVMEDGILQAPAPYAAPDAYYSPTTGRMAGIEVLKGSSQIKYGPRSTGGAINFLSTRIPTTDQVYLKAGFGSFSEIRNHAYYGGTSITKSGGKFGYLVEMYTRNNRGFKSLIKEDTDGIASLRNGAELDSGFVKVEPMLKLSYEPKSALYQRWEAKFGHTNLDANETYLGLPEGLSRSHTYGRLAATRFDEIESTQYRSYIRHLIEFSPKTSLTTTLYGNTFNRNWQKLNDVGADASLSQALANPSGTNYQILAGKAAGDFTVRNNNRAYYSYGAQMTLAHQLQAGEIEHNLEVGVRLHEDQIRRKQWDEVYTQDANGNVTSVVTTRRGAAGNRTQNVFAMSTHLQDQMKFGKFTFTPGMRIENMSAEYCDGGCGNAGVAKGDRTYAVVVGGGSLKYDVFDSGGRDFDVFGGIHRGFSPADPRSNIRSGITEETSIGMELGARYKNAPRAFSTEAVLFNTILDDLVVADSIGGAGAGSSVNAGKVQSLGLELQVNYDRGLDKGWAFQMPMYVAATYTSATFLEIAGGNSDAESIFAGANIGNQVPYIPELNLSFGIGTVHKKWSTNIDANFVSIAYADAANQNNQANPITGTPDVRFGSIPSRLVIDGSLGYKLSDKARIFGNVKNMMANEYIISRQPEGPRPGLPFSIMAGLELQL